jgi:CheY-like chemotaxis protein
VHVRPIDLLLVDDDELDVMNVQRALAAAGVDAIDVVTASDGVEALALLRSGAVRRERLVVVLDLRMPRMGGLEMLRVMRGDPALAALPVIVLTTSDDARDLREAYALHVAGYFVKPSTSADYRALVGTLKQYWGACARPAS